MQVLCTNSKMYIILFSNYNEKYHRHELSFQSKQFIEGRVEHFFRVRFLLSILKHDERILQ